MTDEPVSLLLFVSLALFTFWRARHRILGHRKNRRDIFRNAGLTSLPRHYGYYAATVAIIPFLIMWGLCAALLPSLIDSIVLSDWTGDDRALMLARIKLMIAGSTLNTDDAEVARYVQIYKTVELRVFWGQFLLLLVTAYAGHSLAIKRVMPKLAARASFDVFLEWLLFATAAAAILITIGIIFSLSLESYQFFSLVGLNEFLFGSQWSPQTALREDQVGASGSFGAIPLFAGTALVSLIALSVAGPVGLLSAIYLNQYAQPSIRNTLKPLLEVLAGIPTVVFGFFAAVTVAPIMVKVGQYLGLGIESESALVAGSVMGLMIIPYISSLADDTLSAVPKELSDASLALGATQSETTLNVILPAARQGLMASMLLAVSRAIGETMIVVMAVGMRPNLTANPFEAVTTVTVQIVALLTGDQAFDQPKTLSAFALGLVLFATTLLFNLVAQRFLVRPAYRQIS